MNPTSAEISLASRPRATSVRLFRVQVGRFDADAERATIDELAGWVERRFAEDLVRRPSKHVYVKSLPAEVVANIDLLRHHPVIRESICQRFGDCEVTPMKHTDELYISHYNRDWGGDQGLFHRHYDGNLRFLPYGTVVRALIYLQSDAAYTVVFSDSGVEKAFGTYDFGLLDFHRELHWVVGEYQPAEKQRILLKCNYLVAPLGARWLNKSYLGVNTAVFYIVKAAMEYSKCPKTPAQRIVGAFCNLFRVMNNVHPLVPLLFIAVAVTGLAWLGNRLLR